MIFGDVDTPILNATQGNACLLLKYDSKLRSLEADLQFHCAVLVILIRPHNSLDHQGRCLMFLLTLRQLSHY